MKSRRNENIRENLNIESMADYIEGKQLGWWEQLQNIKEEQPVRQVCQARIRNKSGRERPKEYWDNVVTKLIVLKNTIVPEPKLMTKDRKQW